MKRISTVKMVNSWVWFYIFCLILSSYSVYMIYFPITTIVHFVILCVSAITILLFAKDGIQRNMFFIPMIALLLFTIASCFTTTDTISTISFCLRFLAIAYAVAFLYRRKFDLFRLIYQCLFFLMIFYFCCYVLFDLLFPNLGLSYIRTDFINLDGVPSYSIYENHYNIYLRWVTTTSLLGINIKRLAGFCWEAGQYQIYLNFILMYLLFFERMAKNKKIKILFTILNIILCGSSMGYLLAVSLIVIFLMQQKNRIVRILCFVPLIVIGGIMFIYIIKTKSIAASYSYTNRMAELELITDILFRNNIFGAKTISINGSNGLIRFLWSYGYLAVAVVLYIARCIWKSKSIMNLRIQKMVFSLWLLLSFMNEPIEYFNFTFLIIAIVIADAKRPTRKVHISSINKKYLQP